MKLETKVLIFKGGGYDGCFWEWNALIFEGGKATQKLISGRYGEYTRALVTEAGAFRAIRELYRQGVGKHYQSVAPYLIRNEKQWDYFFREWNSGFARRVAEVAGHGVRCDRCGGSFSPDEIYHTGYKGDGGVGVQFCDNKCQVCADTEHDEYIAGEWKHLRLKTRVEAIRKARNDGCEVSIFAARRDDFPGISGRHVWEPEYY